MSNAKSASSTDTCPVRVVIGVAVSAAWVRGRCDVCGRDFREHPVQVSSLPNPTEAYAINEEAVRLVR